MVVVVLGSRPYYLVRLCDEVEQVGLSTGLEAQGAVRGLRRQGGREGERGGQGGSADAAVVRGWLADSQVGVCG